MMNKRGQQEIVGFVLIVLVVTVIGVILLTLSLVRNNQETPSLLASNLLSASMYTTTDCVTSYVPQYKSVQELVRTSYRNPSLLCQNGKNITETLRGKMKEIISTGLDVDDNSPNKAYKVRIYYEDANPTIPDQDILNFEEGNFRNCSYVQGGTHILDSGYYGQIHVELDLCKGGIIN